MRAHVLREWPHYSWVLNTGSSAVSNSAAHCVTYWLAGCSTFSSFLSQTKNLSCDPCILTRRTRYSLMLLVDELNFPLACLGDRKRLTPGDHGLCQQNIGVPPCYVFALFGSLREMLLETLHSTPLGTFCLLLVKVQRGTSSAQIFLYEDWQLYSAGTLNPRASLPDGKGHLLCQDEMQDKTSISDELGLFQLIQNSVGINTLFSCSAKLSSWSILDDWWVSGRFYYPIINLAAFWFLFYFISWRSGLISHGIGILLMIS